MTKLDGRTTRHPQLTDEEHALRKNTRRAITHAIWNGGLPDAKAYKCHGCDEQARVMHHQSYHPNDVFCLVPLCASCHGRVHTGSLALEYGVVPMRCGLVRIAISHTPS